MASLSRTVCRRPVCHGFSGGLPELFSPNGAEKSICPFLAVELEHPENFFAIQFAPDDWNISSSIPRVDAPSSDSVSQSEMREYELQRLSTVMNALIALLAEKGVLTRTELAEILKQEN